VQENARNARRNGKKGDFELITALALGKTVREAASLAGINEANRPPLEEGPEIKRQVAELTDQMHREAAGMLARGYSVAVFGLLNLIKSGSDSVKLGACRAILDQGPRFGESLDVVERVADLEQRLSERKQNGKDW